MTDFKVGDRVRCTLGINLLEGFIDGNNERIGLVAVQADGDHMRRWLNPGVWHIEKVSPPLPTKQYAVVGHPEGKDWCGYTLINQDWYFSGPSPYEASRSEVEEAIKNLGFEVIFEGVDA